MDTLLHARALLPVADGPGPFDLTLPPATVLGVVGRDTALRTTFLRTLAAAHYPAAGEVELLGQPLSRLDDREWLLLRREAGLVTREAPLVSSLDALRNVTLPALYHGLGNRGETASQAQALLQRLGYAGDPQRLPAFQEEADRRILALARAMMMRPKLLFLDDPLHGLHAADAHRVAQAVAEWCKEQGASLIFATDDATFLRTCADRVLFIAAPVPREYASWSAFHGARDPAVQEYFSTFRTEAKAFD